MKCCRVKDCPNPHVARGMCRKHFQRLYRSLHPQPKEPLAEPKKCSVADCKRDASSLSLCRLHRERLRKTGTTAARVLVPVMFCDEVVV